MEEPTLLLPVERIVRGIEIEHDPRGGPRVGVQEVVDEAVFDGAAVMNDPVVARGLARRALEPVQRGSTRQSVAPVARLSARAPSLNLGPEGERLRVALPRGLAVGGTGAS